MIVCVCLSLSIDSIFPDMLGVVYIDISNFSGKAKMVFSLVFSIMALKLILIFGLCVNG